jgi:hypothetical protein
MNKNLKRVLIVLFDIILVSILFLNVVSSAASVKDFGGSTSLLAGTNAEKATISILGTILTITRTVGAAVAIGILMIIGCKYLMASAGDRADIKKYAMNYVIGAIILFGAAGILGIVQNFVNTSLK